MSLLADPNPAAATEPWPAEVQLIISALAAGEDGARAPSSIISGPRDIPRMPYRVMGQLQLFSDPPDAEPWRLYIRDASVRGLGFITPHRLPLGYGGTVELPAPNGHTIAVNCVLLRCREITSGWFDGALYFNREQALFAIK